MKARNLETIHLTPEITTGFVRSCDMSAMEVNDEVLEKDRCRNKKAVYFVVADCCSPWPEVIQMTAIRRRKSNLKGFVKHISFRLPGEFVSATCLQLFSEEFSALLQ